MNIPPASLSAAHVRRPGPAVTRLIALGIALSLAVTAEAQSPAPATATAGGPDVMTPATGASWTTETQPDLAAFNRWAQQFAGASPAGRAAVAPDAGVVAEGVRLARTRQDALLRLVHSDPARVIAAGVPSAVRARLPAAVLGELETPFSAVGDYTEQCELRALGGPAVMPTRREIKIGGHVYPARVYGRRFGMATRRNLFLHGVLIGGVAVLDENVLRVLPADEAALDTRAPRDLSTTAAAPAGGSGPVLAEGGGTLYRFASDTQLRRAESALRALEAHRTPETSEISEPNALEDPSGIPPTADSAYTTGTKKVLIVRVDFSDLPGDPTYSNTGLTDTAAYTQNIADTQVKPYYTRSSYNLTSLSNTVTTKLYRLPRTAADYATNNDNDGLHTDAETAAGADFNVAGYDRVIVIFSFLGGLTGSQIQYGGLADVGGRRVWVNGEFDFRVVSHELGHTYGLIHGNLWQVTDGNPLSLQGSSKEYGDDFDTIGANFANTQAVDFNVWYKTQLDWVPPSQVKTVTASGTYRVSRFDGGSASGIVALKIVKDGTRNYWISARRNFTNNSTMTHGVYVTWGYNSFNLNDNLLDLETPGTDDTDAALPTGDSFTDSVAGISVTALDEGGTSPNEFEDVKIDLNTTGTAPVINSATAASGTVGVAFSYQIAATNSPTSFAASDLPPGLSVDTGTGVISGSPTASGTFSATISAINGGGTGSASLKLTIAPSPNAPTISSFSPTSGPVGTTVVIQGTGFGSLQSVVFAGNAYAAGSFSSTQVTATVPSGAVTGPITLNTADGSVSTATSFTVGTVIAPTISSFSPGSGAVGSTMVIHGTGFVAPLSVIFTGNVAAVHGFTATQINVQVPSGASSGPIKVNTANGSVSTASGFTVTSPPTITGFNPASGAAGTTVTLTGTNFVAPLSVIFGGNVAAVHSVSPTVINAQVPAGAITGPIKVNTSYGSASTASSFTVPVGAPTISSFSPGSGAVGSTVVIHGTGFVAPLSVIFGGNVAAVHGFNATQINATVPGGAKTGVIKVNTSNGSASTATSFTVTP